MSDPQRNCLDWRAHQVWWINSVRKSSGNIFEGWWLFCDVFTYCWLLSWSTKLKLTPCTKLADTKSKTLKTALKTDLQSWTNFQLAFLQLMYLRQWFMSFRHKCSGTGLGSHVCLRVYLRNLLKSAAGVDQLPPLLHCIFVQFFWSWFVNLPCRKPEIVSLEFDSCQLRRLNVFCRKAHDSKTNGWHAVRNPSGYPAFVWLLCRYCSTESSTEENANAQNSRVAVTPIILTTMHNCANPTLACTSCHVCRGASTTLHAHPKPALSTARLQGRGVSWPCTQQPRFTFWIVSTAKNPFDSWQVEKKVKCTRSFFRCFYFL